VPPDPHPDSDPDPDPGVDVAAEEPDDESSEPRPVDKFRATAAGTVIAAGLLGMRDALEGRPEKEEVAIVNDAPEPAPTEGFTLVFDEDDPASIKVVLPPPASEN
jgi:hypothetical protein